MTEGWVCPHTSTECFWLLKAFHSSTCTQKAKRFDNTFILENKRKIYTYNKTHRKC
jgi:hypothetical protein